MSPEEYKSKKEAYDNKMSGLRDELASLHVEKDNLRERYVREALRESGYSYGQKYIDKKGVAWFVSGAFESNGNVFLLFNKAKKDGTMSKLSGLGNGQPRVKIK